MKALIWKELRENRIKLIITFVLLIAVAVFVAAAYTMLSSGMIPGMEKMPADVANLLQKIMPDFSNINSYLFSQWFSKNLEQVGALLAVILLTGTVAGERELHTAVFLFSRPVSRKAVLAAKAIVLLSGLCISVIAATLAAAVTSIVIGKTPDPAFLAVALLHALVALLVMAAFSLLVSVLIPDRIKGALVAGAVLIVCSLLGQVRFLRWLNPLALFGSRSLVTHPVPQLAPLLVGTGLIAVLLWLAYQALERQEF